ncbi:hypothetical protein AOQ84DRAFT_11607 [Glonium stellatum]|uniref:Uncharacterized protein n=1 Tax=Glonium stellatum TaxID=574774 RepID=A0A8E2JUC8_9PEZI|nr:hypothetical protein AOQ84DRAFT_11607 [Glonium stellatum]
MLPSERSIVFFGMIVALSCLISALARVRLAYEQHQMRVFAYRQHVTLECLEFLPCRSLICPGIDACASGIYKGCKCVDSCPDPPHLCSDRSCMRCWRLSDTHPKEIISADCNETLVDGSNDHGFCYIGASDYLCPCKLGEAENALLDAGTDGE